MCHNRNKEAIAAPAGFELAGTTMGDWMMLLLQR
jgi:hypothetical protein